MLSFGEEIETPQKSLMQKEPRKASGLTISDLSLREDLNGDLIGEMEQEKVRSISTHENLN